MAVARYHQVSHSGIRAMTKKKKPMTLSQGEQGWKTNDLSGRTVQALCLAVTNGLIDEEMCFNWQVTTSPLCARLHSDEARKEVPWAACKWKGMIYVLTCVLANRDWVTSFQILHCLCEELSRFP